MAKKDKKVKLAFDRQTRYSTLRGMMMAKGMFKVENGKVVVDPNANTSFASVSASVKLPDGSANAPASPDSGSGSTSGSQTPPGSGSDTGGSEGNGD